MGAAATLTSRAAAVPVRRAGGGRAAGPEEDGVGRVEREEAVGEQQGGAQPPASAPHPARREGPRPRLRAASPGEEVQRRPPPSGSAAGPEGSRRRPLAPLLRRGGRAMAEPRGLRLLPHRRGAAAAAVRSAPPHEGFRRPKCERKDIYIYFLTKHQSSKARCYNISQATARPFSNTMILMTAEAQCPSPTLSTVCYSMGYNATYSLAACFGSRHFSFIIYLFIYPYKH